MSSVRVMRHVRVMSLMNEAFLGNASRAKVISRVRSDMMIIIAFAILNSSLVPLIESSRKLNPVGLKSSVSRSHLLLFFFGSENILKKKSS